MLVTSLGHLRRILAGLIIAVVIAGAAVAGPLEDATAAFQRGDYATALNLWKPMAEQGDANAQYELGVMYVVGNFGVKQSDAEAMKWFRLAAEQGYAKAQSALGGMYHNGGSLICFCVPQDFAEALKWYRRAAEQGDPNGQSGLGFMYLWGQGVPQDYVQSHMWFNLAAAQGGKDAANAANDRDAVAAKMTPDQIAEAQRLAREWKPKARP